MLVVGPVEEVVVVVCLLSLALLQAEVWVVVVEVVVVWVKPAFSLGGITGDVVVAVVVPQSFVLAAWAAGENQAPPTAVNAARVIATVRFLSDIGLLL
ncbi:hypothetical protein FXV83_17090 [Bradyrhizobium hipponense]|uniref:Uncharacterized protein n=1 Tax=Bradyrhizobium hipponense TaxID=2605638 RepID=A0A5S4YLJ9_9BRAD|nr:hypothetical protein [Bradyrhizobium hipponense]TYO65270.1 hypothetical protein FXV83_17090 [Bradyrhizobium hipponense]